MGKSRRKAARSAPRMSKERAPERPSDTPELEARPAIVRALEHVKRLNHHSRYLVRLVGNWNAEATAGQQRGNDVVVAELRELHKLGERVFVDLSILRDSGFNPVESRSRAREPLAAGDRVAIRDKWYVPEVYGTPNDFEVVMSIGDFARIRPTGDTQAPQVVIRRTQLSELDVPEGDGEEPPEETGGAGGAGDAMDNIDPDVDPEAEPDPDAQGASAGDVGGELDFDEPPPVRRRR